MLTVWKLTKESEARSVEAAYIGDIEQRNGCGGSTGMQGRGQLKDNTWGKRYGGLLSISELPDPFLE